MDNVCHTLVGAALAESGLGRRTSLGFATLVIGANLPDLDALAYFDGPLAALEWRRGWSHGVVALLVLPLLLTAFMVGVDRVGRRMRRAVLPTEARAGQILMLAFVAVLTHPLLDMLNTYGVRWLLPWNGDWSYGDTLFIIDPWLWLILGAGIWHSRKRRRARERNVVPTWPARRALALSLAYVTLVAASGMAVRQASVNAIRQRYAAPVTEVMASPVAITPFVRQVVVRQEDVYRTATFRWFSRPRIDPAAIETFPAGRPANPAVAAAAATVTGRRFLGWARFPTFSVESGSGGDMVHIMDLRYANRPGVRFGAVTIPLRR
jgi:inner membrane protein